MGPIDYSIDVATPFQSALQGYQAGAAIRDDQAKQQQQQAALAQQQQMMRDVGAVTNNPNAGARDYAALTLKYPALKDQFKQSWDMIGKDQQAGRQDLMTRAYAALSTGRPDIAETLMRDRATAMRNSGAPEADVKAQDMWADMIKTAPEQARHLGGLMLSSIMDPDKFASTFSTLGDQGRAADKAPSDLAKNQAEARIKGVEAANAPQATTLTNENLRSQIDERGARLALDRDKLTSDVQMKLLEYKQKAGDLPEPVMKGVNDATINAVSAQQSSGKMNQLADQIDAAATQLGGGVTARAGEAWKRAFGSQDELSRIRGEYSRIVTPAAMAAYKQVASGSTSDKDIETAMVGVPKDTDSPERMASFLRGAAKLQMYDSVMENAKAEWLTNNKHLGKTKNDVEIDGVKVPAGTTFKQFADQYVGKKVGQIAGTSLVKSLAQKYAAPAAQAAVPEQPAPQVYGD